MHANMKSTYRDLFMHEISWSLVWRAALKLHCTGAGRRQGNVVCLAGEFSQLRL